MTTLMIEHDGWNVLTSAWTAAAKANNNKSTELCYVWSTYSGTGITNSATGVERLTLGLPLESFCRYIADCEKKAEVADLTPSNLPKVAVSYQPR